MATIERRIILASQSPYRRVLLSRLTAKFSVMAANIDETPFAGESPANLATRLATNKATAIATLNPDAVVIGSDQVAALGERVLGKPGNADNAAAQLTACSGQTVKFYSAVTVLCRELGFTESHTDVTSVHFRELTREEIDAYLQLDQPWDCAGSFKSEAHGSLLFESLENTDPTGLIGLPIIWLGNCLRRAGIQLLT